ncbi:MAG: zinc ribbon domain-containing protein, partial [Candidatus Lokiarchaeota archaeon]|nr:zinc ribbon domain-containing protein [Candidatus Lokiarchaeota archaeon]
HNNKETFNDTITLTRSMGTTYDKIFNTPSITSGYGIFYIIPIHDNYTASDSPRHFFKIVNYAPIINDLQSYFTIGDGDTISLSDTIRDESTVAFQAKKGDEVSFQIRATELEFYGDMDSDLLVSVNFFIVAISEVVDQQRVIWPIYPYTFNIAKLTYNSGLHTGSLIIPSFMEISTINGIKDISTNPSGQLKNYACILYINVIDKEGSATDDPYLILLMMEADPDNFIVIITVSLIGGIFLFAIVLYVIRRKKIRPKARDYTYNEDLIEASTEEVEYSSSINQIDIKFCPFCGIKSSGSNKFCTNCGKQFKFE